ncbi:hypothetical protein DPMN_005577 [Dreissena polymorpha]|uniref:Uncharacterized protein n=1 Tax=Dreissena polymorpha TaxID=45954 RepID=A0A9D4MTR7_DREPO|nr:hypothetical protein DPMN_005577 [Dreissena polymorpha]
MDILMNHSRATRKSVRWTVFGHLGRRGRHATSSVATGPSPEPETARFHQTL